MATLDEAEQARKELLKVLQPSASRIGLTALHRDQEQYFTVGTFACKKKLANGAVVRFSIVQPNQKRQT